MALQNYVFACISQLSVGFFLAIKTGTEPDCLGMVDVCISYPLGLSQVHCLNGLIFCDIEEL